MNKNIILNIVIVVLVIAVICAIAMLAQPDKENVITDENTLRDRIRENITHEYITKPQEENAIMVEREKIQNEEMKNEEARQQEEIINEMAGNVIQSVKNK